MSYTAGVMAEKQDKSLPAVKFTNQALKKLSEVVKGNPNAVGLRLQISGRTHGKFEHVLSVVERGKVIDDDIEVTAKGLPVPVYVEKRNADYLDGVKVHYEYKGVTQSGLEFSIDETGMVITHGKW